MKSVSTNNLYQSTFMPIFQNAETKIKVLILTAFLLMYDKSVLMTEIMTLIKEVDKKIPKDLKDRQTYLNGLNRSASKMVYQFYDLPKLNYINNKERVLKIVEGKKPIINNPSQLETYITQNKPKLDLWAEQKGVPYIKDYGKQVKTKVNELAETSITTDEPDKKSISLWQKAELDIRHDNQMQQLNDLTDSGVELAWISSHPNCSKRCEAWQGELVSLTQRAANPDKSVKNFKYRKSSFVVGKVDGHKVYSLLDIMDTETGNGYTNNIINGFNCRHHLVPYTKGTSAPKEFTEKEIKQQREIEQNIRDIERNIRKLKSKLALEEKKLALTKKDTIESKTIANNVKLLKKEIKSLTDYYKSYCERNGYSWYQYRIDI